MDSRFFKCLFWGVLITNCCIDNFELVGANYTWVIVTWESDSEYGVQGVFCADFDGGYDVCAGFEVGALYQGSSEGYVFR